MYIAVVEGEEPEKEEEGYTLLKYMEKKGNNQFVWGKLNLQRTAVDAPIPAINDHFGLNKNDFKKMQTIVDNMAYFPFKLYFFNNQLIVNVIFCKNLTLISNIQAS